MKRFWTDKIAIATALVGVGLMLLTLKWHVNPVEGSVVPEFLQHNPAGRILLLILLVTCMPVWMCVIFSYSALVHLPQGHEVMVAYAAMLLLQGFVYFMIGKLFSRALRASLANTISSGHASEGVSELKPGEDPSAREG